MTGSRRQRTFSVREIFAAPLALAVVGVVGLVSALVGNGSYDAASWIALGLPICLCAFFLLRGRS